MSFVHRSRRMGERLAVHGLVLDWNTRGRRSPRWKRRQFDEADVIDVSVSGAQFLAPDNLSIIVGQKVTIVAGGSRINVTESIEGPVSFGLAPNGEFGLLPPSAAAPAAEEPSAPTATAPVKHAA